MIECLTATLFVLGLLRRFLPLCTSPQMLGCRVLSYFLPKMRLLSTPRPGGDFIDVTRVCGGKSEVWWLDMGYLAGYPNVQNRDKSVQLSRVHREDRGKVPLIGWLSY